MARMNAPGGHDRTGFLGRAKQLLRRKRNDQPPPVVRPAHLAPMRGGVNLPARPEKPVYRAKPAKVYTGVVPGSRAANRPALDGLLVSRKRAWALIIPLRNDDGIEFGTMTTYSRKRRGLMRLSRQAGILPVLVTS